jgi:hypothetical protein
MRFCIAIVWSLAAFSAAEAGTSAEIERLLDAIEQVETGGQRDPANVRGDGGRSLGPYQIMRGYWQDAGMPGRYEQVRDRKYARETVRRYWKRHCPKALEGRDLETLARVHNGGPAGHRKAATRPYWRKVQARLKPR